MAQTEQLSLSWDAHQKSICSGLSVLQQRGEFVDMTLAADGHHVKVHQMVLSLVSPYIKDLISTAQCSHPIIFLNNISYTTLCAILEYIYTGEVVVPTKHQLSDLIAAGKALHIRGLREMADEKTTESITAANASVSSVPIAEMLKIHKVKKKIIQPRKDKDTAPKPTCEIFLDETSTIHEESALDEQDSIMEVEEDSAAICENSLVDSKTLNSSNDDQSDTKHELTPEETRKALSAMPTSVEYAISKHGSLHAIINRYVYQLRYTNKKAINSWRCIFYNNLRCPATIHTSVMNKIIQRKYKHVHPFQDKQIAKFRRNGVVYPSFQEAAIKSSCVKEKSISK